MSKKLNLLILLLFVISACARAELQPAPAAPTESAPQSWWRSAVFYEIFVRSFKDSNADGIGDFNGITQQLDYLQELGVNAIWLMPISPSPSYHGYDVTDYYAVNPQYGTMADFKRLLSEVHARNMHLIIDLVLNHTSSQHPFFVDANNDPASKYRDYYLWSDTDPGNNWHKGQNGYYFGLFCDCMPDLNYNNPKVSAEMENVVKFWLADVGADGFRVDAAKHLIEDGKKTENTPATHEWLKGFYTVYKKQHPQAYTVGEVFGAGASLVKSYTGSQLDQIFNFEMASGFVNSANGQSNSGINSAVKFALMDMPDFNFATFITNHDQNRVLSVFNGNVGKAKVAATMLLTSPGTPFIYYGEEIGMSGVKPDEDIRLPMQWDATDNAGFSSALAWRAPNADYIQVNVAAQKDDPESLFNYYRKLLDLRKEHPALQGNGIYLVDAKNSGVYSVLRVSNDELILVLINLTGEPISDYALTLEDAGLKGNSYTAKMLVGSGQAGSPKRSGGGFSAYQPLDVLSPHGSYIIQLIP